MTVILPDAIFFDFDGVLVDSTPIKVEAFTRLYSEEAPDEVGPIMDYLNGQEGISRVEKIREVHRDFLGIDLTEDELATLAGRYSGMVVDAVVACPAVAGAEAFIEAHAGRIPLFVVTGTPEPEILGIVERRGMGGWFTAVRGSPPRKPPIIRELLAEHGLNGGRCVFIGDASFDWESATGTGLNFIGRVPEGEASPFPPGTVTVRDLTDLPRFLNDVMKIAAQ